MRETLTNAKIFISEKWLDDLRDTMFWLLILGGLGAGILYLLYTKLINIHEKALNDWLMQQEQQLERRDSRGEDS